MANAFNITIVPNKEDMENVKDIFSNNAERLKNFYMGVTKDCAEFVNKELEDTIPKDLDLRAYRESLNLKGIDMKSGEGVAIVSDADEIVEAGIDGETHIIYFTPIQGSVITEFGRFLLQNSPFVLGAVEEIPQQGIEAVVQKVTKKEAYSTRDKNLNILDKIEEFYLKEKNLKELKGFTPNVGLSAVGTELGLPGHTPKAHWRPALKKVTSKQKLTSILEENAKKSFSPKMETVIYGYEDTVSESEVKKFKKFQEIIR